MQDRIQKEKDFHNDRFAKENRDSLNKFYSISALINNHYQKVLFNECKGKRILEYGCGLGSQSSELSKFANHVNAIDISEVAIDKVRKIARERGMNNISFDVMNAETLNFPDNYFDVVCGVAILHHLNLESSYSELSRVLKPGGKAYFIEPLGHNPFIKLFRKITPNLRTEDEHPLVKKDLLLLKNYFKLINIKYYYLTSLLSIPFKNKKYFIWLLNFLNSIDQILFKINFIKLNAWQVVIEISDPKK